MSGNEGLDALNVGIEGLLNNINVEVESERRDTTALELVERTIDDKRRALVEKRENIARLERKATLLYAVKAVEELPQGTRAQRHARFQELVGLKGIATQGVHPSQLSQVLEGTAIEAYATVFLIS